MRGLAFGLLEEYLQSIDDFSVVLEREPKNLDALFARGNSYLQDRYYQHAIDDFDKVLKVDKKNDNVYSLRGMAYLSIESYTKALNDINQAIKINPNEVKYYQAKILLVDKTTQYSSLEAVADLKKISELEQKQSKSKK